MVSVNLDISLLQPDEIELLAFLEHGTAKAGASVLLESLVANIRQRPKPGNLTALLRAFGSAGAAALCELVRCRVIHPRNAEQILGRMGHGEDLFDAIWETQIWRTESFIARFAIRLGMRLADRPRIREVLLHQMLGALEAIDQKYLVHCLVYELHGVRERESQGDVANAQGAAWQLLFRELVAGSNLFWVPTRESCHELVAGMGEFSDGSYLDTVVRLVTEADDPVCRVVAAARYMRIMNIDSQRLLRDAMHGQRILDHALMTIEKYYMPEMFPELFALANLVEPKRRAELFQQIAGQLDYSQQKELRKVFGGDALQEDRPQK